MSEPRACPICRTIPLIRREGRLDQSGETYLPTLVWCCTGCGYERWDPALGVRWLSAVLAPRGALQPA